MFIFNLSVTVVITLVLGILTRILNKRMNLNDRIEEILLTWFIALALLMIIRTIANIALHYQISHQVGTKGRKGLRGIQGLQGEDSNCI